MNRLLALAWCAVGVWARVLPAAENAPAVAVDPAVRAREILEQESAKVPGVTVAVAVAGRIVWSEAFGFADVEAQRPLTTATRMRIGSVSKPLTAAGLMVLVERGRLDLDAPVQRYVPDFPVKGEGAITTRLLGGHLGGIRHYGGNETSSNVPYANVRAGLKIFENDPLVAPPGTKFHYTTYGWSVIAAVMESAAGREFTGFMAAEVFGPLGMTRTRPDRAGAVDPDRTQFYEEGADGKFVVSPPIDVSYKWAGGGFLSTSEDLARFGSALLQPGFLKQESLALLFTSQKTTDGHRTGYGIGWSVETDQAGRARFFHTGGQQGCSAILFIAPETKVVVAMLTNVSKSKIIGRGQALADLFAPAAAVR